MPPRSTRLPAPIASIYARVALEKSDYTVDHSAFIYLMGRHGEYLGFFPPGTPADILVGTLKPLVAGR